jgi:hypothetical protein
VCVCVCVCVRACVCVLGFRHLRAEFGGFSLDTYGFRAEFEEGFRRCAHAAARVDYVIYDHTVLQGQRV